MQKETRQSIDSLPSGKETAKAAAPQPRRKRSTAQQGDRRVRSEDVGTGAGDRLSMPVPWYRAVPEHGVGVQQEAALLRLPRLLPLPAVLACGGREAGRGEAACQGRVTQPRTPGETTPIHTAL
jgi:hypothetical protein